MRPMTWRTLEAGALAPLLVLATCLVLDITPSWADSPDKNPVAQAPAAQAPVAKSSETSGPISQNTNPSPASTSAAAGPSTSAAGSNPSPAVNASGNILTSTSAAAAATARAGSPEISKRLSDDNTGAGFKGWAVLPAVFYLPEWGFSATGAALLYFQMDDRSAKKSEMRLEGTVTSRGGYSASIKPKIWLDGGKYKLYTRLSVSHRPREFFGFGNDTPSSAEETYDSRYFAAWPQVSRQLTQKIRLGLTGMVKHNELIEVESDGLLAQGNIPGTGTTLTTGMGLRLEYDTRDSTYAPRSGELLSTQLSVFSDVLGGDFNFISYRIDLRHYIGLPYGHVVGLHARSEHRFGTAPFFENSRAGGKRLLRGMVKGRYNDNHLAGAQVEYRLPVFWRVGMVGFAGVGRVANRLDEFDLSGWKYSVGTGLRFAARPDDGVNIRADMGYSDGEINFYLDILEAF